MPAAAAVKSSRGRRVAGPGPAVVDADAPPVAAEEPKPPGLAMLSLPPEEEEAADDDIAIATEAVTAVVAAFVSPPLPLPPAPPLECGADRRDWCPRPL